MCRCKTWLWVGIAVALFFTAADSAHAQYFYGSGFGPGTAYNGAWVNERMPFYTQYPPVYYGQPTPRPYGYSPFAYTPLAATPHVSAVNILNPYVEQNEAAPAPRPQPITIKNPYVVDTLPPGKDR